MLYWSDACLAEGNSDFLNLVLPSTSAPVHSALPRGHALAQASIPDDGTFQKVSLYCSVGSLQDVLMVAGYELICTYYGRAVECCWYTPCSPRDLGASATAAIF